ncbi:hypothetical protein Hanom_Chr00s144013g01819871 [Helianthus anomalus]
MEGLIPTVYKSIKRSMTVKQHSKSYNIADFYPEGYIYKYPQHQVSTKRSKSTKNRVHEKQLVRFRSQKLFSCITGGV